MYYTEVSQWKNNTMFFISLHDYPLRVATALQLTRGILTRRRAISML